MFRVAAAFCLASLLLCSVGCRMCCTPYDYCIPAHIVRHDDFRGCGPMYRAGSILTGNGCNTCQMGSGNMVYVGNSGDYYGTGDFYSNAGNYGMTTPVVQPTIQHRSDSVEIRPGLDPSPIAKPPQIVEDENMLLEPYRRDPNSSLPTVDDLIQQPRREPMPNPMRPVPNPMRPVPITPPAQPKISFIAVSPCLEQVRPLTSAGWRCTT